MYANLIMFTKLSSYLEIVILFNPYCINSIHVHHNSLMQILFPAYIYDQLFAALLLPYRAVKVQSQASLCIAWLSCVISQYPKLTNLNKVSDKWWVNMSDVLCSGDNESEIDSTLDDAVSILVSGEDSV